MSYLVVLGCQEVEEMEELLLVVLWVAVLEVQLVAVSAALLVDEHT